MHDDTPHVVNAGQTDPLVDGFFAGELLVYPTEAVMGLGCDPDNEEAVMQLLALKKRVVEKGLILIAGTYSQLLPYVNDDAIRMDKRTEIFSSWPGANTWLLPKSSRAPDWITGGHPTVAVRVTGHPVVRDICERVGKPLVSTSANLTGQPPALTIDDAKAMFADAVTYVPGEVGGNSKPSVIRDGNTGAMIRE
ncbi:Sua5/YciO/YrdC/YwlC family protein [Alteromonas halophila]|uniref:Threonylcarbamoyl-AMP synthase n=1 Tax=Alteromonas halophila TaxID=516698 RepID=A0A918N137_9ALTE|nr:Sua5/YciO/YrdC/YwlC family protein [Alteromonas halophila]GGW96197.1 threonylcarbamoyl-AMP synthase [Alteromonas halophila]